MCRWLPGGHRPATNGLRACRVGRCFLLMQIATSRSSRACTLHACRSGRTFTVWTSFGNDIPKTLRRVAGKPQRSAFNCVRDFPFASDRRDYLAGTCSVTVSTRPSSSLPLSARIAARTPSGVAISDDGETSREPGGVFTGEIDLGDIAVRRKQAVQLTLSRAGGEVPHMKFRIHNSAFCIRQLAVSGLAAPPPTQIEPDPQVLHRSEPPLVLALPVRPHTRKFPCRVQALRRQSEQVWCISFLHQRALPCSMFGMPASSYLNFSSSLLTDCLRRLSISLKPMESV